MHDRNSSIGAGRPPFATLFIVPFVYFLGVHGSSLAFSLLSIGCLGISPRASLCREFQWNLTTSQKVLLSAVFLGRFPMFWVVRAGQWGGLLRALVVIGWYCVRWDRPIAGGLAVGIAASLKLFPALLLVYFFLRHRRGFVAGVGLIVALNAADDRSSSACTLMLTACTSCALRPIT